MSRAGRWIHHTSSALLGTFKRRPVRSGLLALVLLASLGGGGYYSWAVYSWRQAQADLGNRKYAEANRRLEFCRKIWPDHPSLLLLSAKTARKSGDLESSQLYLSRFFNSKPESRDEAQIESLLLRVQVGDDEAVEPLFKLVEQQHPDSPEMLETISLTYMKRLRYQAANGSLSRWIELYPDQALPYDLRGWVYERTASPALAYEDYNKALAIDPGLQRVRLQLVGLLLEEKKVTEAAPHLDILMKQAPDVVEVKARLGMLRFLEGRSQEARQLLEAIEPLLTHDLTPVVYLARLDVQENRGADAERRLRRVIESDPTETDARFVILSALRLQGKDQEAAIAEKVQAKNQERNVRVNQLLRDRVDKSDTTADELAEVGTLFLEMQMDSRGIYWIDKALARDPNHQASHRVLMGHYDSKGDTANAAFHRKLLR